MGYETDRARRGRVFLEENDRPVPGSSEHCYREELFDFDMRLWGLTLFDLSPGRVLPYDPVTRTVLSSEGRRVPIEVWERLGEERVLLGQ